MEIKLTDSQKIQQALAIKDLTDPANGVHAINIALEKIVGIFSDSKDWPTPEVRRSNPISTVSSNFDRLYFPQDSPSRSPVYTRYITEDTMLRVHTTVMIPDLLLEIRDRGLSDYLILCPGACYRRDVVDRKHTGEPHQLDIWRIKKGMPRLKRQELIELVEVIIDCMIPGHTYRANEVVHPYTINGLEVEILVNGNWLELLECGEAHPQLLADAGLDPKEYSGLAMGMGLDRLVMTVKGVEDIRLLRSEDPRIKRQMINLDPYLPVSKHPPIKQDMSIAVSEDSTEEDVCETIRDVMGPDVSTLEEVVIISETPYDKLPAQVIERLGIHPGQKNLLVRIILRSHERSLLHEEANELRDKIYKAVHQGEKGYVL